METQLPLPNGAQPPIFGPCLLWPNGWLDQDATWYRDKPPPKQHCVRWGPISPKKDSSPTFRLMYCGQTAGLIKMPLGTEVGCGPGDIVLHGNPALLKGTQPLPLFVHVYYGKRLDGSRYHWYGGMPRPRPRCLDGEPAPLPKKGKASNFRPMSVVAKRLDGSRCHLVRR